MLYDVTFWVNFLGLALNLWLGLYLVTRNSHSRVAWLTALMLWSMAGMFLNVLLALSPPPQPVVQPAWLRLLFPFWPGHMAESQSQNSWLLGWTIGPAIVLWHHVTTIMRGSVNAWRSFRISSGYLVAGIAIWLQFSTPWLYTNASGNPLYINALRAGVLFPLFGSFILLFSGWSLINLYRSTKSAPSGILRRQFRTLTLATLIAGTAAPIALAGTYLDIAMPIAAITIPLMIGIVLAGSGVARYSALVEGRTIRRDFIQFGLGSAIMGTAYMLVMAGVSSTYDLPRISYVAAIFLAILSYSLVGVVDRLLERILLGESTREFKTALRRLNRLVESPEQLDGQLNTALDALCAAVLAEYGVIYEFRDDKTSVRAWKNWHQGSESLSPEPFIADDVQHIQPGALSDPHADAALLIPLYVDQQQLGAIVLGRPHNSLQYSTDDVDLLLDPADMIADALHRGRSNIERLEKLAQLAQNQHQSPRAARREKQIAVKQVESALRNLGDYAYLGDSPLAELKLTDAYLDEGQARTYIEVGKAVARMLADVVEKLHPDTERPGEPVPREWYAYLILYDAYFIDVPNRDIMSRLYISEGTFNRTRRAALRAVTRVLEEMEVQS